MMAPDVAAELAHEIPQGEAAAHHLAVATPDQPWPAAGAAYYALAVIIFATFLNFFDSAAFGLLIEQIKTEFHLSNTAIGLLQGPVNVVFYMVVMLPLSRCSDIYPRKYVLAVGALLIALLNATGGFTSTFMALAFTRMLVGAGGGAHAPGAYSMLADFFPPEKRRWPFALLQLGFIGGGTIGLVIAGRMLAAAMAMPAMDLGFVTLHGWKYVLLMLAVPGVVACLLLLLMKEPPRRGGITAGAKPMPIKTVFAEMYRRRAVYGPLFLALGFSTAHAMALPAWMTPFFKRTYGWTEIDIAARAPLFMLAGQLAGLVVGPLLIKTLASRYRDANIRAVVLCMGLAMPLGIVAPMMPSPWLALACMSVSGMLGIMGAVPQNLIIQEITPNQMRGQVTGLYLMMFTAVGAVGPFMVGFLTDTVFGSDGDVWKAMVLLAAVLSPAAVFTMSRAVKPYGAALDMLEAAPRG
ncbi:MAG TPA: MFS transporter [Novosphingobium sp.]|nr:MFS transporter [Novosphingobium sp.]